MNANKSLLAAGPDGSTSSIYMLKHFGDLGHSLYFACTENSYPNLSSTLRKYERREKKSMNDAQLHLSSQSSRIVFSKQYP